MCTPPSLSVSVSVHLSFSHTHTNIITFNFESYRKEGKGKEGGEERSAKGEEKEGEMGAWEGRGEEKASRNNSGVN